MIFNDGTSSTQDNVYNAAIDLYPNPTNGILKVNNYSNQKVSSYTVYNISGYQLETGDLQEDLDIINQPSGVYYIKLEFEDGSAMKKVIKI